MLSLKLFFIPPRCSSFSLPHTPSPRPQSHSGQVQNQPSVSFVAWSIANPHFSLFTLRFIKSFPAQSNRENFGSKCYIIKFVTMILQRTKEHGSVPREGHFLCLQLMACFWKRQRLKRYARPYALATRVWKAYHERVPKPRVLEQRTC